MTSPPEPGWSPLHEHEDRKNMPAVNTAEWLMAIDAHPDTLDTDLVVAEALANGESTVDGLDQELVDDSIEEAIAYARRGHGNASGPAAVGNH